MKIEPVRKIAVVQAKALGDFIVLLPALWSLRSHFPQTEIVYLGKPWHKTFLEDHPSPVDRVEIIPPVVGVRDEPERKGELPVSAPQTHTKELEAFLARMQQQQFDIAVHFQGNGKHLNPFLHQLGARYTAGMADTTTEPLDASIPYAHFQSEVLRALEIVKLLGVPPRELEPRWPVTEEDASSLKQKLPFALPARYVVFHLGADDLRRLWPIEKFVRIEQWLHELGYTAILTGTMAEKQQEKLFTRSSSFPVLSTIGLLSLHELAALLAQSALVLSADTGPLHLARAVGARTVGVYWEPNVVNWGPLSRQKDRMAIGWQLRCPRCGLVPASPWPFEPKTENCTHPFSFVENVSWREVRREAQTLVPELAH